MNRSADLTILLNNIINILILKYSGYVGGSGDILDSWLQLTLVWFRKNIVCIYTYISVCVCVCM